MEYRGTSPGEWLLENRRLVLYLLSFLAVALVETLLYWWGMRTLEGRPRSVTNSVGTVVQSLTTTGYGQDAPWTTPFMQALVIAAQFTGIAYLFFAFPLFVGPWIRAAITDPTVPEAIENVDDHVVICGHSSLCRSLVDDLEAREQPYVIVDSDEDHAETLLENGRTVVHGDLRSDETLRNVNVTDAIAVVIGVRREDTIGTLLSLEEYNSGLEIVCLIDEPEQSRYLRYAGATTILSPKHRLGKSLADRARNVVGAGLEELDGDLEIAEFPVTKASPVHGRRLADLDEITETGAVFVGAWIQGEFVTRPTAADSVDENTVLVVGGTESQLARVRRFVDPGDRTATTGPVIIAGHGITGTTVEGVVRKAGRETTVIDTAAGDGVDVVGDVTNEAVLAEAGIDRAETIVLTLSDDEDAILATLVARESTDDLEIIVAANDPESARTLYSAGADYVLALPTVAGRMTMLELFGEDVMTLREQIRLSRTRASEFDGEILDDDTRRRADAVIVGVQRNGDVVTDIDDGFRLESDDELLVAGTDQGVSRFEVESTS